MIPINGGIRLAESELHFSFIRAGGPGGQHVNKAATAVQLRFDAAGSPSLPDEVRQRLLRLAGSRATASGEIVIEASRFRSQDRNRIDAIDRLVELVRRAAERPRRRRPTRPTRAAKQRRLDAKRRRGAIKRQRQGMSGGSHD